MAVVCRLADVTQTWVWSFYNSNLQAQTMTRTPNGDGWLTTTMTLVSHTSDGGIMAAVNVIDELAERCDLFWSDLHRTSSVWLEESATAETTKRSLVQSIELAPIQEGKFAPTLGHFGAKYTITIIHSAAWENTAVTVLTTTNVSCLGGTVILPAISGSLPGRLHRLDLAGDASNTGTLTTFWGGIRPVYDGDTDFSPLIELEKGTLVAPCVLASDSDEASPLGTTDNVISYGCTTDDVKIDYVTLDNALTSTNYNHWIGDYHVLMRAKLSAAQTVRLHIDTGYYGGTVFIPGPYNYNATTDYTLLEMGTVSIPPFPRIGHGAGQLDTFEFQLYAKLIGTATTITADCLILIPATHYYKISSAIVTASTASTVYGYILEDALASSLNYSAAGQVNMATQFAPNNWEYPMAGGILVLAGQRSTLQNISDEAGVVRTTTYTRYRTHGDT